MISKIYLAIIFSDYQELNLKRFIDHSHIKNEIIIINGRFDLSRFKKNSYKFPKNVKIKYFSNKYVYLIYLLLLLIKYLFHIMIQILYVKNLMIGFLLMKVF